MESLDLLPQVQSMLEAGRGDRVIAETLGITRHQARNLMREVERGEGATASERVIDIPVALCRSSPSARPLQPGKVLMLIESIREIGLRNPIGVRPVDGGYEIRGGGHRHAAFVQLGRETIPAIVRSDDDLRAELAEIDENLCRADLSPGERASAITRRKAIYEALHPETRPTAEGGEGRRRETRRQVGDESVVDRFTKTTARATGLGERTIQRDAARGEALGEHVLAKVIGSALDTGEELDALARLPEARRDAVIERAAAGEKVSAKAELKRAVRADREAALGERQAALPQKRYGVILADPEWRFEPRSRETGMDRAADNHYPTSTTETIMARDVPSIAADDCVLFLWATAPMLPDALRVMGAWGFDYVSHQVGVKDRIGTGYWFRNQHELVLVGTRGNVPAPAPAQNVSSVFDFPVGAHSAKPECVAELIERWFPNLPKIELNRRGPARPGWDAWGNELQNEVMASAGLPDSRAETANIIEMPEPAAGDGHGHDATRGAEFPLTAAERPREPEVGAEQTASAADPPALLAPGARPPEKADPAGPAAGTFPPSSPPRPRLPRVAADELDIPDYLDRRSKAASAESGEGL